MERKCEKGKWSGKYNSSLHSIDIRYTSIFNLSKYSFRFSQLDICIHIVWPIYGILFRVSFTYEVKVARYIQISNIDLQMFKSITFARFAYRYRSQFTDILFRVPQVKSTRKILLNRSLFHKLICVSIKWPIHHYSFQSNKARLLGVGLCNRRSFNNDQSKLEIGSSFDYTLYFSTLLSYLRLAGQKFEQESVAIELVVRRKL